MTAPRVVTMKWLRMAETTHSYTNPGIEASLLDRHVAGSYNHAARKSVDSI